VDGEAKDIAEEGECDDLLSSTYAREANKPWNAIWYNKHIGADSFFS